MSWGDSILRGLGKVTAGLFGAGLLAWAGVTAGEWFMSTSETPSAFAERLEEVEIEASAAWRTIVSVEDRTDAIETRMNRLEARADAISAPVTPMAAEVAPAAPARPQKPKRRKPKPPPAALPPASSHWRF